jgi:hypothetical protein
MIVAREKRKTNIAEYIIYMWQIEDLIRAYNFDTVRINRELVKQYEGPKDLHAEIGNWYAGLAESMLSEGIKESGHLQYLDSLVDELNDFHFRLVDSPHHSDYQKQYLSVVRDISEFRKKMPPKDKISDMEVCLTALYGLLLMRLKKRQISEDTEMVIKSFGELLSSLSRLFQKYEQGTLEI